MDVNKQSPRGGVADRKWCNQVAYQSDVTTLILTRRMELHVVVNLISWPTMHDLEENEEYYYFGKHKRVHWRILLPFV